MNDRPGRSALGAVLATSLLALPLVLSVPSRCAAQSTERERYVPERVVIRDGVMVWEESAEEAALVGAHYAPAYYDSYTALGLLGKDRKEAIREVRDKSMRRETVGRRSAAAGGSAGIHDPGGSGGHLAGRERHHHTPPHRDPTALRLG